MGKPNGYIVTPVMENPDDKLRTPECDDKDNLKVNVQVQADAVRHMEGYCPETEAWKYIRVNSDGEIVIDPIDTEKIADGAVTSDKLTIEWTDWTPTYGAGGSMTYTSVTTSLAKYIVIDKVVYFMLSCFGTTGGNAAATITFTVPVPISDSIASYIGGGCVITDVSPKSGIWVNLDANTIMVFKYDASAWGIGANKYIIIQGFYRIA